MQTKPFCAGVLNKDSVLVISEQNSLSLNLGVINEKNI